MFMTLHSQSTCHCHPSNRDEASRNCVGPLKRRRMRLVVRYLAMILAMSLQLGPVLPLLNAQNSSKKAKSDSAKEDTASKSKADTKKRPTEFNGDEIDPEKLPPGYVAPPDRLSIFDLEQPIASKEEMEQLKKESLELAKIKPGDTSATARKAIDAKIHYFFAEMTLKEKSQELPKLKKAVVDYVSRSSQKQIASESVVKYIPELLKNQYHVRLQAAELLGEIDYAPAYPALLKVLQSKDIRDDEVDGQPEAVKVAAAKSLVRLLRFSGIRPEDRMAIALAVASELKQPDRHWWLQIRLIEALRYCDISGVDATTERPFVIDTLLSLIKDPNRSWRVRTKACYAIGRVPLPSGLINSEDIVTAVADCALQLSNEAAANPQRNSEWRICIWNVYLAFHKNSTKSDPDLDAEKKDKSGLLEKSKASAQPAYDVILPIVNDVLNDKGPDAGNLKRLSEFMKSRQI